MLNIISVIIGVIALILGVFALLPILGIAFWLIIPLAFIGACVGALSDRTSGRNLNLVVIIVGILRLSLTGGLF